MIAIPYGKSHLDFTFPYNGLLTSRVDELKSDRTGRELVEEAMASPIGTPGLAALAAGKKRCTIIISDHTRPVPSRDILPPMLAQLRQGNPEISGDAAGSYRFPPAHNDRRAGSKAGEGNCQIPRKSSFTTPLTRNPMFRSAFCPPAHRWSSTGRRWTPTCSLQRVSLSRTSSPVSPAGGRVSCPASAIRRRCWATTAARLSPPLMPARAFWRATPFTGTW